VVTRTENGLLIERKEAHIESMLYTSQPLCCIIGEDGPIHCTHNPGIYWR
jgi:hypothetical protein